MYDRSNYDKRISTSSGFANYDMSAVAMAEVFVKTFKVNMRFVARNAHGSEQMPFQPSYFEQT
jgi:hypothetical protein